MLKSAGGLAWALCALAAPAWAQSQAALTTSAPVRLCHEDEDNSVWISKDGRGASVVLVEMAAAKAGVRLTIEGMPWRRCLALVERGLMAGVLGASYTDERARYAVYPMTRGAHPVPDEARRVSTDEYSLYRAIGADISWNGKAFSNARGLIGYQTSFSIGADLKRWGVAAFDGSKSPDVILRRVVMGTLQGAALQTATGDALLNNPEFAGKIERVTPSFGPRHYFLMFGKIYYSQNEREANALWEAIEAVRKSAEYKAQEAALIEAFKP